MIVLLFSVMAGLAALARGVLFTTAVCLALVASVTVLVGSLRLARAVGGPTWIPGVLAILAFVLVVGGPAYLLAIRGDSVPGSATPDDHGPGDDSTGDTPTSDSDVGGSEEAVDEGPTPDVASPVDAGDSADGDDHAQSEEPDGADSTERDDTDSEDHPHGADGARGHTPDDGDSHPRHRSDGDESRDDPNGDGESLGTPGG